MPIIVRCECGQQFQAKDELAGKRLKCPKCQRPLQIPASGTGMPADPLGPTPGADPLRVGPLGSDPLSADFGSPAANPLNDPLAMPSYNQPHSAMGASSPMVGGYGYQQPAMQQPSPASRSGMSKPLLFGIIGGSAGIVLLAVAAITAIALFTGGSEPTPIAVATPPADVSAVASDPAIQPSPPTTDGDTAPKPADDVHSPTPKPPTPEPELEPEPETGDVRKRLVGGWVVVRVNGKQLPPKLRGKAWMRFMEDGTAILRLGPSGAKLANVEIDTSVEPAHFNITGKLPAKALFRMNSDKVTLAFSRDENKRPEKFGGSPGDMVFEFERENDKTKVAAMKADETAPVAASPSDHEMRERAVEFGKAYVLFRKRKSIWLTNLEINGNSFSWRLLLLPLMKRLEDARGVDFRVPWNHAKNRGVLFNNKHPYTTKHSESHELTTWKLFPDPGNTGIGLLLGTADSPQVPWIQGDIFTVDPENVQATYGTEPPGGYLGVVAETGKVRRFTSRELRESLAKATVLKAPSYEQNSGAPVVSNKRFGGRGKLPSSAPVVKMTVAEYEQAFGDAISDTADKPALMANIKKHRNSIFEVTGRFQNLFTIDRDGFREPQVFLADPDSSGSIGISCVFRDKEPWTIANRTDMVTIRGQLIDRPGEPVQWLDYCEIVRTKGKPADEFTPTTLLQKYKKSPAPTLKMYEEKGVVITGKIAAVLKDAEGRTHSPAILFESDTGALKLEVILGNRHRYDARDKLKAGQTIRIYAEANAHNWSSFDSDPRRKLQLAPGIILNPVLSK